MDASNNSEKTKTMRFQKRLRKSVDISFKIGFETIEIVQEYTYLGTRLTPTRNFTLATEHLKEKALHAFSSTRLTPTRNFTLATEHLKEKALHAFSSIRKDTLLDRLHPNTASQIFDTMIFPILSYNSEVWGMYTKQNLKKWDSSPIEKIHLQFSKRYQEVNNKASNLACRA